jgi:hypothetical protein
LAGIAVSQLRFGRKPVRAGDVAEMECDPVTPIMTAPGTKK